MLLRISTSGHHIIANPLWILHPNRICILLTYTVAFSPTRQVLSCVPIYLTFHFFFDPNEHGDEHIDVFPSDMSHQAPPSPHGTSITKKAHLAYDTIEIPDDRWNKRDAGFANLPQRDGVGLWYDERSAVTERDALHRAALTRARITTTTLHNLRILGIERF